MRVSPPLKPQKTRLHHSQLEQTLNPENPNAKKGKIFSEKHLNLSFHSTFRTALLLALINASGPTKAAEQNPNPPKICRERKRKERAERKRERESETLDTDPRIEEGRHGSREEEF